MGDFEVIFSKKVGWSQSVCNVFSVSHYKQFFLCYSHSQYTEPFYFNKTFITENNLDMN